MSNAPDANLRLARLMAQSAETAALMGVDFLPLGKPPAGAMQRSTASPAVVTAEQENEPGPAVATPVHDLTGDPERAAKQAALDELRARYERDAPHKNFVTSSDRIVFGEGDPAAALMFIGEAPGADEERTGRPFVGKAGRLLDKMIVAMGISRSSVYIANVLKTRPPDNATPTLEESAACAPYLFEQVAIIRPRVIVTLGLPAVRTMLNTQSSMGQLRGQWARFVFNGAGRHAPVEVDVMPTYHPSFLLRAYTDENRAKVWSDLQQAMTKLGLSGGKR
ncbi:MAG: uracil-DNA glycosylase [Phycisphaerales bacterium]